MMRTRLGRLAGLLALLLAAPSLAHAQMGGPVPLSDPLFPIPTAGTAEGCWYAAVEFASFSQTNPIKPQLIGFRGFVDTDGSITGKAPGTFVGSQAPALSSQQVSGPTTMQPGMWFHVGYRFEDGMSIDVSWLHLFEGRYSAGASLVPENFQSGTFQANAFVTAPVFNFPINYAGPQRDINIGNPTATYGIWNAASDMTLQFIQRFEQVDVTGRIPIYQNDCWRTYGLVGGRAVVMWEEFRWFTDDSNVNGIQEPIWQATYTNIVSNRLYGPHAGIGNEWFWGSTPIGAFSCSADVDAGLFLDFVKERAGYELGDKSTAAHRNKNVYTIAPEIMGSLSLWWYPTQGIQCRVGWDTMAFFNTISSPRPVDFNYGALDPSYESTLRVFSGVHAGIGFAF